MKSKSVKLISILIIIGVLLSGCISGNKSHNTTGNNKDEYATDDGSSEETDQNGVQAEYDGLNISNTVNKPLQDIRLEDSLRQDSEENNK